jgi:glucose-1-phosphate cytidylyltransferase
VQPFLGGEETFLANYSDGLSDLPLPKVIDFFRATPDAVACFAGVNPTSSFHLVKVGDNGRVQNIRHVREVGMRINGGFFVFRSSIFDWMQDGEELVQEPFQRLAEAGRLLAYPYDGFWACMDTFKEKQMLEDLYSRGQVPWEVWKCSNARGL